MTEMKHKTTWHLFHWIMIILFFPWVLIYIGCWVSNSNYNTKQKIARDEELLYYLKNK